MRPAPKWLITYEGTDISDEIAPMVLSAEYVDNVSGKSDELQLTLDDRDGLWREGWWPSSGDSLAVKMGYEGQPLLDCGAFKVDEVGLRGKPDTVTISAQAVPVTSPLRSVVSRAYDKVTLRSLVERIAGELELEVCGEIVDVPIAHITQSQETTLAFLRRLAQAYGYAFSVRPPKLVFYDLVQLEASKVVMRYGRTDLASYDLKGSNQNTYVACEVSYLDPTTKELRKVRVEAAHARTKTVVSGSVAGDVIIPTRTLRQGSSGDDVKSWQTWVTSQGCDVGTVDGKFGAKTRRGTVVYQQRLEASPDGVVGPETVRLSREAGWGSAAASAGDGVKVEVAGRVLRKTIRVETIEQAELQARALLLDANRLRVNGTLAMSGDPCLVAGATIELGSMGRVSGAYLIQSSAHRVGRSSGYSTSVEVTCV